MTPRPLPWMKPGDLVLFELELLPWPAYLGLIEAFFRVRGQSLLRIREGDGRALYHLLDAKDAPEALLLCRHARRPIEEAELWRLREQMAAAGVRRALLFTPGSFASAVYLHASDLNVELYSANKLRVRIENLRSDLRREVMNAIRATPAS